MHSAPQPCCFALLRSVRYAALEQLLMRVVQCSKRGEAGSADNELYTISVGMSSSGGRTFPRDSLLSACISPEISWTTEASGFFVRGSPTLVCCWSRKQESEERSSRRLGLSPYRRVMSCSSYHVPGLRKGPREVPSSCRCDFCPRICLMESHLRQNQPKYGNGLDIPYSRLTR